MASFDSVTQRGNPEVWAAPPELTDPVAKLTQWHPMAAGGASFRTHTLSDGADGGLVLKKSAAMLTFGAVFLVPGLLLMGVAVSRSDGVVFAFGLLFAVAGTWAVWPRSMRFDAGLRKVMLPKHSFSFSEIHAVQLLAERVAGKNRSFVSYELNLVLHSGSRVHLIDHANHDSMRTNATRISGLLGCPVWDTTK